MAVGLQTNFRDPRFQRMLLQERASRPYAALPVTGAATRQWVGQDLDTRLRLEEIGLSSKLRMGHAQHRDRLLKLREKELRDQGNMLPWEVGVGLGTAGIGGLMGMRQRRRTEELAALRQQQFETHLSLLRQIAAQKRL